MSSNASMASQSHGILSRAKPTRISPKEGHSAQPNTPCLEDAATLQSVGKCSKRARPACSVGDALNTRLSENSSSTTCSFTTLSAVPPRT
ncbi:hypothetical protein CHU98_g1331 [Xylaria longipes]|nr:hypothetical protein CHU98_g1331 [Xylaria longipes]